MRAGQRRVAPRRDELPPASQRPGDAGVQEPLASPVLHRRQIPAGVPDERGQAPHRPLLSHRRQQAVERRQRGDAHARVGRPQDLVDRELSRQGLNGQEVSREARLPADAFRSLRRGYRPTIDRADELCRALGITMMIGGNPGSENGSSVDDEQDQKSASPVARGRLPPRGERGNSSATQHREQRVAVVSLGSPTERNQQSKKVPVCPIPRRQEVPSNRRRALDHEYLWSETTNIWSCESTRGTRIIAYSFRRSRWPASDTHTFGGMSAETRPRTAKRLTPGAPPLTAGTRQRCSARRTDARPASP